MKKHFSPERILTGIDTLLGTLIVVGVCCLIFIMAHKALFDPDIWLHMKTGEVILQDKSVPARDIFSFTVQGKPWIDHEPLFQVATYLVFKEWGVEGLILLQSCIILLAFWFLFRIGFRKHESYILTGIFIFVAAYASSTRFNIRPDMFSLCFFILYFFLLRFYLGHKRVWLLLPLQVAWANCHGYFFLGPLVVFLYFISEYIRRRVPGLPWSLSREGALTDSQYAMLKKLLLGLVLACFLTPNGIRGALYPLLIVKDVLSGQNRIFFNYIQELKPTFDTGKNLMYFFYYKLTVLITLGLMAVNLRRLAIFDILLMLVFLPFSLTVRHMAFFSFVCFIIVISYIGYTLQALSSRIRVQEPLKTPLHFILRYFIAAMFIFMIVKRINATLDQNYFDFETNESKSLLLGRDDRAYPKKAVDFVLQNSLPRRMFNDFNSGAYLIGRAYPKRRVFIDGRTELYGSAFFQKYLDFLEGNTDVFRELVDKYRLEACLLSSTRGSSYRVMRNLYLDTQWSLVFLDEYGSVFVKRTPATQALIDTYAIDLDSYEVRKMDLQELGVRRVYPSSAMQMASLFNLLEKDELVLAECREALSIMPNCAEAFHLMGKVYLRKKLYRQAFEHLRSALLFIPRNVEVLVDYAACLTELGQTEKALKALKNAVRLNAKYASAYYGLGCVYLKMEDLEQSMRFFKKAIGLDKKDPRSYLKLGVLRYQKAKKTKDAALLQSAKDTLMQGLTLAQRYNKTDLKEEIARALEEAGTYQKM